MPAPMIKDSDPMIADPMIARHPPEAREYFGYVLAALTSLS